MNKPELITAIISAVLSEPQGITATPPAQRDHGQNIVVLDRGFVYVGNVVEEGDYLRVTNAKNIRYWGTKKGLGELRNGPLAETKLDDVGEILAPKRALIHLVPCKGF